MKDWDNLNKEELRKKLANLFSGFHSRYDVERHIVSNLTDPHYYLIVWSQSRRVRFIMPKKDSGGIWVSDYIDDLQGATI